AAARPNLLAGTAAPSCVLGADDGGEANLTYTWAVVSAPAGAGPVFSGNGTNAAKNTTVTFNRAGNYLFQVTITDAGGLSTTSSVVVSVNQTLSSIAVTPAAVILRPGAKQLFLATAFDQFGQALASQPFFLW